MSMKKYPCLFAIVTTDGTEEFNHFDIQAGTLKSAVREAARVFTKDADASEWQEVEIRVLPPGTKLCPDCDGSGRSRDENCGACGGSGRE